MITMNIGLNDKDSLKQEIETQAAIKLIANLVGDCTIKTGNFGIYTMDNGETVIENSLEVISYTLDMTTGKEIAKQLCKELNQESIYVSPCAIDSELVRA